MIVTVATPPDTAVVTPLPVKLMDLTVLPGPIATLSRRTVTPGASVNLARGISAVLPPSAQSSTWRLIRLMTSVCVSPPPDPVPLLITTVTFSPERVPLITPVPPMSISLMARVDPIAVSYTHLRAHETKANLVCRLLLEKKKK